MDKYVVVALCFLLVFQGVTQLIIISRATDYSVWRYHKVLTVTNSTALPVGYQLNFTLWKGVGVDYAGNFYLNNHASDNLYDLRFVDGNGILLDMWNQTAITDETHVHTWIELASSLIVVMYYGNEYASSEWDTSTAVFERVITSGVVLALPLSEGTGSTVYDYSGNGLDFSVTGATWVTTGRFGNALSFDGDGDYLSHAHDDLLEPALPFSILLYYNKTTQNDNVGQLFWADWYYKIYRDKSTEKATVIYRDGAGAAWRSITSDALLTASGNVVSAIFAVSTTNTNTSVVIDETVKSSTLTGIPTTDSSPVRVGRGGDATEELAGNVCGIYIFNYALVSGELADFNDYYPQSFSNHLGSLFLREYAASVSTSANAETDTQSTDVTTEQDVNWMAFIVLLAFAFLNVALMLVPRFYVLNFVVGALTLATAAATVNDSTLPIQPYFSLIVALLSVLGILRAANMLRDS